MRGWLKITLALRVGDERWRVIEDRCDIGHFVRSSAEDARRTAKLINFAQPPRVTFNGIGYILCAELACRRSRRSRRVSGSDVDGMREIGWVDPALATCLVTTAPSAPRGLTIFDRDCGSQFMLHDFLCLGEQVVRQVRTEPGVVVTRQLVWLCVLRSVGLHERTHVGDADLDRFGRFYRVCLHKVSSSAWCIPRAR